MKPILKTLLSWALIAVAAVILMILLLPIARGVMKATYPPEAKMARTLVGSSERDVVQKLGVPTGVVYGADIAKGLVRYPPKTYFQPDHKPTFKMLLYYGMANITVVYLDENLRVQFVDVIYT